MDSLLKSKIEKALEITQRVTGSWAAWRNRRTNAERGGGPTQLQQWLLSNRKKIRSFM